MTDPYLTLLTLSVALLFLFIGYQMGQASVHPKDEHYTPMKDMGENDMTELPDIWNDNLYVPEESEERIETVKEG